MAGARGPRHSPGALLFVGVRVGFHQCGRNGMWKYPERCRVEAGSKLILERPKEVKCDKKFLKHCGHKAADLNGLGSLTGLEACVEWPDLPVWPVSYSAPT